MSNVRISVADTFAAMTACRLGVRIIQANSPGRLLLPRIDGTQVECTFRPFRVPVSERNPGLDIAKRLDKEIIKTVQSSLDVRILEAVLNDGCGAEENLRSFLAQLYVAFVKVGHCPEAWAMPGDYAVASTRKDRDNLYGARIVVGDFDKPILGDWRYLVLMIHDEVQIDDGVITFLASITIAEPDAFMVGVLPKQELAVA